MANQIDNVLLSDDTTGLPRSIDVGSDALVLSTDLTLQAGGILASSNIQRGTADPNVALIPGNEGDLYQRTLALTGELWVNGDGTTTGWTLLTSGSIPTWAQVLGAGPLSGGVSPILTSGDELRGQAGASLGGAVLLRGATPSSGTASGGGVTLIGGNALTTGAGGSVTLTPGAGAGGGAVGTVIVNGRKNYANSATDPVSPAPAAGDRYYNTALEMEMIYDGTRAKWLSVESNTFPFGRNGNTAPAAFYRVADGLFSSATIGYRAFFNGTVVAFGYTRADVDAATFDVTANGAAIFSLASAAVAGGSTTANANFAQNQILALANQAGSNITTNVIAWVRVRWRA